MDFTTLVKELSANPTFTLVLYILLLAVGKKPMLEGVSSLIRDSIAAGFAQAMVGVESRIMGRLDSLEKSLIERIGNDGAQENKAEDTEEKERMAGLKNGKVLQAQAEKKLG